MPFAAEDAFLSPCLCASVVNKVCLNKNMKEVK